MGRSLLSVAILLGATTAASAQLVPGTGSPVADTGDDLEDPEWDFVPNLPKSSRDIDNQERQPTGYSTNGRFVESAKRGHPDILKRVPTPPGGLPGSEGALMMKTLYTGIPNRPGKSYQDDLILDAAPISVAWSPSIVVRAFLPPFEEWEDYTGTSFGLRASIRGRKTETNSKRGLFGLVSRKREVKVQNYWPGFFIQFNSKTDAGNEGDSAFFIIRADENGHDFIGPQITKLGWWTLGMSFTPDGSVHYYAKPGIKDLTPADHISSQYPYGFQCQQFNTFFFNVANQNNGRTWSTEWIIDDPTVYYVDR